MCWGYWAGRDGLPLRRKAVAGSRWMMDVVVNQAQHILGPWAAISEASSSTTGITSTTTTSQHHLSIIFL